MSQEPPLSYMDMMQDGLGRSAWLSQLGNYYDSNQANINMLERESQAKWELDVYRDAEALRNTLQGKQYNPELNKWEFPEGMEPRISAHAASEIVELFFSPYHTVSSILNNFSATMINNKVQDIGISFNIWFQIKSKELGIDISLFQVLSTIICDTNETVFQRAYDEGERKARQGERKLMEHTIKNETQSSGGFWNKLRGIK